MIRHLAAEVDRLISQVLVERAAMVRDVDRTYDYYRRRQLLAQALLSLADAKERRP